jgi:hypothetical protein
MSGLGCPDKTKLSFREFILNHVKRASGVHQEQIDRGTGVQNGAPGRAQEPQPLMKKRKNLKEKSKKS